MDSCFRKNHLSILEDLDLQSTSFSQETDSQGSALSPLGSVIEHGSPLNGRAVCTLHEAYSTGLTPYSIRRSHSNSEEEKQIGTLHPRSIQSVPVSKEIQLYSEKNGKKVRYNIKFDHSITLKQMDNIHKIWEEAHEAATEGNKWKAHEAYERLLAIVPDHHIERVVSVLQKLEIVKLPEKKINSEETKTEKETGVNARVSEEISNNLAPIAIECVGVTCCATGGSCCIM